MIAKLTSVQRHADGREYAAFRIVKGSPPTGPWPRLFEIREIDEHGRLDPEEQQL